MTAALKKLIAKGKKEAAPDAVSPMLCTLIREPVENDNYLYEVKWDGYRIISHVKKGKVRMDSRSGLNYTSKYPPLVNALTKLNCDLIIDGEVITLNEEGKPDFDALQKYNGHNSPIYYYVFDLLWIEGYSLMHLPLTERKNILKTLLGSNDILRYSDHFDNGNVLFSEMQEMDMEGIVAKVQDSPYIPGDRSRNWLKTPTEKRQEFVIGGWIESDKGRAFSSILFGAYNNKKLEWIGHAGGGYKEKEMSGILARMKKLETNKSPFINDVDTTGIIHYVKPKLVANFKFATWTKAGRIRKPAIFLGFRDDKDPLDVVREIPKENNEIEKPEIKNAAVRSKIKTKFSSDSNWQKIVAEKTEDEAELNISDCSVSLTNVSREIWKGITKADLIQYYHNIGPYILPHIKDRPQSLHIKPINAGAPGFYIKDMEGNEPECADIFTDKRKHKKAGKRDHIDYLVCNNESTLLYMANLGCIDINPWTARITDPQHPDYIVVDLDPSDEDFKKVIECAKATDQYLSEHKIKFFMKTSGKTGMHILLPCSEFDFIQARSIAVTVCAEIQKLVPAISTTEISVSERGTKLYIDPNQNDYADTIAAAYSARPHHIASVSAPIEKKELKAGLDPSAFTIKTIGKRLEKKGDLLSDLYSAAGIKQNNKNLMQFL